MFFLCMYIIHTCLDDPVIAWTLHIMPLEIYHKIFNLPFGCLPDWIWTLMYCEFLQLFKNIFWIPYPLVKDSALIYHENWSFVIENSWEIGQFNAFFTAITAILEFEFRFNSVMLWSLCKEMMRFFRTLKLISIFSWLCLTWCKHI